MLYGAIIGDIAGSEWEFAGIKERPAQLISERSSYTDDTIMTVAVADTLLYALQMEFYPFAGFMRKWGEKYPAPVGGYGGRFSQWLSDPDMPAYNSFGNGAAMRVSPIGWACDTLENTLALADMCASVSHNHKEGIRGAQAVAGAIFLAWTGASKEKIKSFIEDDIRYDLSRTCDEIRESYHFDETCQGTVPEAITAFLESENFVDCIELGISLGGDADTLCAIAGSIAEAYYGVPADLLERCRAMLPADLLAIVDAFEEEFVK